MPQQNTQFDFGNTKTPLEPFVLFDRIISDRGSVYSVSIGHIRTSEEIKNFLKKLKEQKGYRAATHHSWAVRISHNEVLYESKRDDGEVGAGLVILRILQKHDISDCIVCVTRWFGGIKLMGDRFTHIQNATIFALEHIKLTERKLDNK